MATSTPWALDEVEAVFAASSTAGALGEAGALTEATAGSALALGDAEDGVADADADGLAESLVAAEACVDGLECVVAVWVADVEGFAMISTVPPVLHVCGVFPEKTIVWAV